MKYFTNEELECSCCGKNLMQSDFMEKVEEMREALGFPFIVSSAYRCPDHNSVVSKTGRNGPHTSGRAIDIRCSHERAFEIISNAKRFGFTGVGVKQKGEGRFIHLDDLTERSNRPRPTTWSY